MPTEYRKIQKAPFEGNIPTEKIQAAVESVSDKRKQAERHNQGKPQYSLIDLECLTPCVEVLEFGAKKYARNNWKKGMPREQIIDSLLRHVGALLRGEELDPESGLSHIGHVQCNALFLGNKNNTKLEDETPPPEQDVKQPVSFEAYDAFVSTLSGPSAMVGFKGLCPPSSTRRSFYD